MPAAQDRLRGVAEDIAAALPPVAVEVVLTGSVSRGVADELSDIEMLVVTSEPLDLEACFEQARELGLEGLDSWGPQGTEVSRVFGYLDGVPVETVWWPRDFAEAAVEGILNGDSSASAEALANGVALRTSGLLEDWQRRLRTYPEDVAATRIEDAALTWGGFHPTGFLTLARAGDRLALVERLLDDATRVLRIVYAVNRVWEPTSKRLADRAEGLPIRPQRLAERIEEALTEADSFRALIVMTELQVDTVALAPSGPNVDRARRWLPELIAALQEARPR
jgi:hypothetical protein